VRVGDGSPPTIFMLSCLVGPIACMVICVAIALFLSRTRIPGADGSLQEFRRRCWGRPWRAMQLLPNRTGGIRSCPSSLLPAPNNRVAVIPVPTALRSPRRLGAEEMTLGCRSSEGARGVLARDPADGVAAGATEIRSTSFEEQASVVMGCSNSCASALQLPLRADIKIWQIATF
jgi:hypothetical protein